MAVVSEFNRRAIMKAYSFTQGDAGGLTPDLVESHPVWCKIKDLSGSTNPSNGHVKSDADYEVTLRYNAAFNTNWIFNYEGADMQIKSVIVDQEGYKRFMTLYVSVSIQQESWS